jgi:hypothetical protein
MVCASVVALASVGSAAAAAPRWAVEIQRSPTNLVPGKQAEFLIDVENVGDADSDGTESLQIDLPAGVETRLGLFGVASTDGPLKGWDCPFDAQLTALTCTRAAPVAAHRAARLRVFTTVASDATGVVSAQADISGGGAASSASDSDAAVVSAESPGFGIVDGSFFADSFDVGGVPLRQAGSHPYQARARFMFNLKRTEFLRQGWDNREVTIPDENVRTIVTRLPRGFVGNPLATPQRCSSSQLVDTVVACPFSSQVGVAEVEIGGGLDSQFPSRELMPVYNVEPRKGVLATLGVVVLGNPATIDVTLDPADHSVIATSRYLNETYPIQSVDLALWGVPGDPSHDSQRCIDGVGNIIPDQSCPTYATPRAFLSLPSECGVERSARISAGSWENQGLLTPEMSSDPVAVAGCERLSFEPSVEVRPTSVRADGPSGLEFDLGFPQVENPAALDTPPLKRAVVALPEGVTINPAAGDGLAACTDAQLGVGTDAPISCPRGSKVGSVVVDSPALEDPVEGGVYVLSQRSMDPESGEMFRLALVVEDEQRGLRVKLAGSVTADRETGRLVTTFDENPQLPVERIRVRLKDGPRAPLAMPSSCGVKTTDVQLTSWGGQVAERSDSFTIPCPSGGGFAPDFSAGSLSPVGGAFSPFVAIIERAEGDQYLSKVRVDMPKGVLAKLAGVELCPDAVAGDGTPGVCPAGSKIGTATVSAGSGSPFHLSGPVYLTGPHRGAPYGLSVQVPAKAGPFDLGMVKVRNALHVDPETAQASVVSDALPQIVKGVPVRLRSVDVDVDRPGFTINPTSCAEKRVQATLTSIAGRTATASERFQVGDCRALAFKPRLSMRLAGKRHMKSGGHPTLRAKLKQGGGQANIRAAKVTLPPNVVLDSKNSVDPELLCGYDAAQNADCPASSIIGKARLRTPLLNRPLTGPVHFVQGIRFENGNRIRTLPTLLVKLRGEVAINLRSTTNVDGKDRLVSRFPNVPDARARRFDIQIDGGRKGILVVTENRRGRIDLCSRKQTALVETDGHNGKRADYPMTVKTACAKASRKAKRKPAAHRR